MNTQAQSTQNISTTKESRRRHFRDDYKKKVISDIITGKVDIGSVKDDRGQKISKYLVQRWKAEFRGQRFMVDALSQEKALDMPIKPVASLQPDLYQELYTLRAENDKLKRIIAIELGISKSAAIDTIDTPRYASRY